ncbi:MAG: hypothetical protein EAZ53_07145 [Bacteroidetes bacterium]|nr:MAG: hypothetical protein EAZ53_07145 [Bacteroidota bacterium]
MKKVKAMNVTTYTQFRQNLKSELDTIIRMHEPLQVHRSNGEDVIVISKEDFNSMEETFHGSILKSVYKENQKYHFRDRLKSLFF